VDFRFFRTNELIGSLEASGWQVQEAGELEAYPDVETQTRRGYIFAT